MRVYFGKFVAELLFDPSQWLSCDKNKRITGNDGTSFWYALTTGKTSPHRIFYYFVSGKQ
jgi:hypothetical protein